MRNKTDAKQRVAVVTGSSRGIGIETSLTLAENGFTVYATVRNIDKASNLMDVTINRNLPIKVVQLDVTNDTSVRQAIQYIVEREGHIDLLINNAAYTQLGSVEDLSSEEVQSQFNTNVFGIFRTIREVIPIMRKQSIGGTIINIGSANGFFGASCISAYAATKFALEGLTQSLRFELAPFGIRVSIIEPGAVNTDVTKYSMYVPKKIQAANSTSPFVKMTTSIMEKSKALIKMGSSPKRVAEIVLKIVNTDKPEWRYRAGEDAEKLFEARTNMSDAEFEKFLSELLNK
ncbi:MAG: SDR family NAD(P)-dependent oxidoreductase [Nitrososphaeraceae archaeon]|nr:SDR family NAD(P)-dependent oxidoreductase [Nitrososphaeraceae archaeon]